MILLALEIALLAVLAYRRVPLPWLAAWLVATTAQSCLLLHPDSHALLLARADFVTMPLRIAAVAECAWLMIRHRPARRNLIWMAVALAGIGALTMHGYRMHAGIYSAQIVRFYAFPAMLLALFGVVGYCAVNGDWDWYGALWAAHLAGLVVFGMWPYSDLAGWQRIFEWQRWEFCVMLAGWIVTFAKKQKADSPPLPRSKQRKSALRDLCRESTPAQSLPRGHEPTGIVSILSQLPRFRKPDVFLH